MAVWNILFLQSFLSPNPKPPFPFYSRPINEYVDLCLYEQMSFWKYGKIKHKTININKSIHVSFHSISIPFNFLFTFQREPVSTQNWPNRFDLNQRKRIEMILHICSIVVRNSMVWPWKMANFCVLFLNNNKKKGSQIVVKAIITNKSENGRTHRILEIFARLHPALTEINVCFEFWNIFCDKKKELGKYVCHTLLCWAMGH